MDQFANAAATLGTTPDQLKQILNKVGIGNLVKNIPPDKLLQLTQQGGINNLLKNLSPDQAQMLNNLSKDPKALSNFLSSNEARNMINQLMNKR